MPNGEERRARKKKGSAFHAITSGFEYHTTRGHGNDFYWLTLSSPVGSRPIQTSYNQLIVEIRRLTPSTLLKRGYITPAQFSRYQHPERRFRYEAFQVFTSEGNGVVHIIFNGDKIPVSWLRPTWNRIHGQTAGYDGNVNFKIRHVTPDPTDKTKLTRYVLGQYVGNQKGYIRHSCTKGWLWQGYRKEWLNLVHSEGYASALLRWQAILKTPRTKQETLDYEDDTRQQHTRRGLTRSRSGQESNRGRLRSGLVRRCNDRPPTHTDVGADQGRLAPPPRPACAG